MTRKKASLLLTQNSTYVDRHSWLEEFFCERHNKMWMRLNRQADGNIVVVPTTRNDWNYTSHTINPDLPNPSVSEFTHRMSRGGSVKVS